MDAARDNQLSRMFLSPAVSVGPSRLSTTPDGSRDNAESRNLSRRIRSGGRGSNRRGASHGVFLNRLPSFSAAAVVVVPLARRAGLGSVLGYMLAGVIVGPWVLDLVDDEREILHLAEFGVVLLLFVIGLELQPRRLWAMRRAVFRAGRRAVRADRRGTRRPCHRVGTAV